MNEVKKRYGLIYYDIPSSCPDVYQSVKHLVDRYCLQVNLSVYIFDWGFKRTIEDALVKIGANTVGNASVVSFSEESTEQLEELAVKQLYCMFEKIKSSFAEMKSRLNEIPRKRSRYKQLITKLSTYENLTVMYECTRKVLPVLQMLRSSIQDEYKLIAKVNENVIGA